MKPSIEVKNLSKRYKIATAGRPGRTTFREELVSVARRMFLIDDKAVHDETLWALKDISFEVNPGESVGVMGPNGSGKSTLLKILARVVQPTKGEAILRGRVGSILEVGTGFHSELTGRENIYMSGAILGMKQSEIKEKFDQIVDFSGVEKFLDVPVKKYSSGMQVRLAFSVASHFDPDILLVDEALAVGDADFQQKCAGKMRQSLEKGVTLLFVSHSPASLLSVCSRGIVISGGKLVYAGWATEASQYYQSHLA